MYDQILIVDFGSQYTQLIARRIREFNVYCEIHPYNNIPELTENIKGIILSGSPFSVLDIGSPDFDIESLSNHSPVLGVCYGAQMIAHKSGGVVEKSDKRVSKVIKIKKLYYKILSAKVDHCVDIANQIHQFLK